MGIYDNENAVISGMHNIYKKVILSTGIRECMASCNLRADERIINGNRKEKKNSEESIGLMEEGEEVAVRSCHQNPTKIAIVIACIKTLQLESFTMLTSHISILILR